MSEIYTSVKEEFASSKVIETLCEYIKIPNVSPTFDAAIMTNGLQEQAAKLLVEWVNKQDVQGAKVSYVNKKTTFN